MVENGVPAGEASTVVALLGGGAICHISACTSQVGRPGSLAPKTS